MIRRAFAFLLAAYLPLTLFAASAPQPVKSAPPPPQPQQQAKQGAEPAMNCLFYDRALYARGIAAPRRYESEGVLAAALLPHHLLASDMIAGVFDLAAQNSEAYETVVIVSPSHFPQNCGSDVVTATAGWNTPFGAVKTDGEIVSELLKNPLIAAENNRAAVEADHGAAGHIPFLRRYLPNAKVAVCLLSNSLSHERLAEVRRVLLEQCESGKVLLLASADCSHYLMPEEAALRDEETARAIESFDEPRILRFTDSNIDSPQTALTFLSAAQGKTLRKLGHSSSVAYLPHSLSNPIYAEGITTYFVYGAFY